MDKAMIEERIKELRKVENILEEIENSDVPPSAHIDKERGEISTILYESRDGWGETITGQRLDIIRKEGSVSCMIEFLGYQDRAPYDKLDSVKLLDKQIQETKQILATLQTAKEWLEK